MAKPATKRGSVFKTTTDATTGVVEFQWLSGNKSMSVNVNMLAAPIAVEAMMHGLKQKITDAAATPAGMYSEAERWEFMAEVLNRISGDSPSWNAPSAGGGGGSSGSLLLRAICRWKSATETAEVEKYREWLAAKSAAEKTALEQHPAIKPHLDALRAERAKSTEVDSDALLAELG
jgi:hypothetical protein